MEGREFTDFERVTHKGKYAVVYDIAHDKDGGLYYLSMAGSRQMSEGIADDVGAWWLFHSDGRGKEYE